MFFQSSTLYADIQPKIESIVHSHLIKYWYYGFEDKYNQNLQPSELKYISDNFLKRINETIQLLQSLAHEKEPTTINQ